MSPGHALSLGRRLLGAAALDSATYEDVERDRSATTQAMAVVLLSSVAAGFGAAEGATPLGVGTRVGVALLSWLVWAVIIMQVGGRLLGESQTQVDTGELLRTLGFAATPGLIRVLGVIPWLSTPVFVVAWAWMLAAMVVAVRQALDYQRTSRAILVCVVGGLLAVGVTIFFGLLLSSPVS